jgi:hypothetical protein
VDQYTPRQRTDPTVKWLLNERAALAGRISELDQAADTLRARLGIATRRAEAIAAKVMGAQRMRGNAVDRLQALDIVVAAAYPAVNPAAAGVVRARAGRYGARGGLKNYVLGLLKRASPACIATGELSKAAVAHFGIQFNSQGEAAAFRKQVRRLLRTAPHLVEELPVQNERGALGWRWRQMCSLDTLRAEAAAHEAAYPLGPQVGG